MELNNLQRQILEFAKSKGFHGTLSEFISMTGVNEEEALSALRDMKKKHIVSMPPGLKTDWIGVTNYGWKIMGWN